jgi:uncharacterized protein YcnI
MKHRKIAAASAVAALAALAAVPAQAHVTLQPKEVPAGGFAKLDVRVPNERDDAGTTKVRVQFPAGFASVSTEPKPGWTMKVTKRKAEEPIELHGETVNEEVDTVTFTAKKGTRINPGEFVDFGLSTAIPDKAGEALVFPSIQTYDSGEVVRWINEPDAEEDPAPQVTLLAAAEEHGGSAAEEEEPATEETAAPAAPAADTDDDDGPSTGLVVVALILGGLGLVTGVAGLAAARRARTA